MTLSTQTKRRSGSSANHQKRYGQHHKQTKPFLKTYYPYLPLFGIAAAVIIILGARVLGPTGAILGSVSITAGVIAVLI